MADLTPVNGMFLAPHHSHSVHGIVVLVGASIALTRPELRSDLLFLTAFAVALIVQFLTAMEAVRALSRYLRVPTELLLPIIGSASLIAIGGAQFKPFVLLFVVPVMIAAAKPERSCALVVGGVALASAAILFTVMPPTDNSQTVLSDLAAAAALFVIAPVLLRDFALATDAANQRALIQQNHDDLTSLPNLRGFMALAEPAHRSAVERKQPHAILMVNIHRLGKLNDRHGHDAGDRAIALVGRVVNRVLSVDEFAGRYGADKFVALLTTLDKGRAEQVAQRIRNVVFATTLNVGAELIRIEANVGVAKYPLDGVTVPALLSAAEADMQADKEGRDRPKEKVVFRRRSPGGKQESNIIPG